MKKICKCCGEEKHLKDFDNHKSNLDGKTGKCKKCIYKYYRDKRIKKGRSKHLEYIPGTSDYRFDTNLKRSYGISLKEYNVILEKQNYSCAICGTHKDFLKRSLAVDHNHISGKIRGLLCDHCNMGLGHLKDNIKILKNCINYLKKVE